MIRIRAAQAASTLAAALLAAALGTIVPVRASQDAPKAAPAAGLAGLHDFDFLVGDWQVHHRRLKERLAGSREWEEFEGTLANRPLMDGAANVSDNVFRMPGGDLRGVGLRAYDPHTGQWASWWLDGRNPLGNLDPALRGRFAEGTGTFTSDDTLRGKPIRVRVLWSRITPTSARWEQAYSGDDGKTWEVNWISDFRRKP